MLVINLTTEGLTPEEKGLIYAAADYAQYVLNTDAFRVWVLNYTFNKKVCKGSWFNKKCHIEAKPYFHMAETITRAEVYRMIMAGKEKLSDSEDQEADINLKIDRGNAYGVIGYTRGSTKWQWMYSWVLKKYTVEQIAGNLIHEWCHKLGFSHESKKTADREHSLPYEIGYFVRDFVKNS